MSDILDRVFGSDPNPKSDLPSLPYRGPPVTDCTHVWSTGLQCGLPYWECFQCRVMRSEPPEES